MREFEQLFNEYSSERYSMYSRTISESNWGNKTVAEAYLDRYWLSLSEYNQKWKPIQDRIFVNQETGLPQRVFAPEFELIVLIGGILFTKEDFARLQECILAVGDKSLVIVENTFGRSTTFDNTSLLEGRTFRMKYPAGISWDELTSGNFVSSVMIEMPHNEYFLFSESASWGRYAANDYENPLDVTGFKREHAAVFREKLCVSEADQREIAICLPPAYSGGEMGTGCARADSNPEP